MMSLLRLGALSDFPPSTEVLVPAPRLLCRGAAAPQIRSKVLQVVTDVATSILFDIRVDGRRRHDDVRETLRDYDGSLYRTVRRVLLKPSLKRFVRTRGQCWTVERRRQCLDAFLILGREEVA